MSSSLKEGSAVRMTLAFTEQVEELRIGREIGDKVQEIRYSSSRSAVLGIWQPQVFRVT